MAASACRCRPRRNPASSGRSAPAINSPARRPVWAWGPGARPIRTAGRRKTPGERRPAYRPRTRSTPRRPVGRRVGKSGRGERLRAAGRPHGSPRGSRPSSREPRPRKPSRIGPKSTGCGMRNRPHRRRSRPPPGPRRPNPPPGRGPCWVRRDDSRPTAPTSPMQAKRGQTEASRGQLSVRVEFPDGTERVLTGLAFPPSASPGEDRSDWFGSVPPPRETRSGCAIIAGREPKEPVRERTAGRPAPIDAPEPRPADVQPPAEGRGRISATRARQVVLRGEGSGT